MMRRSSVTSNIWLSERNEGPEMPSRTPLWPAQLDHFRIDTDDPPPLIAFYEQALGMAPTELDDGTVLMQAPGRRLLIGRGVRGAQPFIAFKVQSDEQLDALRRQIVDRGLKPLPNPSAVFGKGAFAVRDPDGLLVVFGRPRAELTGIGPTRNLAAAKLPGRLQHVVVASKELPSMLRFYGSDLGFVVSDYVLENGEPTVGFFRSDAEHHSFAVFQSAQTRPDHHAYETTCWNDIRDWADHLATLDIKLC